MTARAGGGAGRRDRRACRCSRSASSGATATAAFASPCGRSRPATRGGSSRSSWAARWPPTSGTGSCPRPRATRCSSSSSSRCWSTGACLRRDDDGWSVHGRPRGAGRPADDPGPARRPPRRADPRGARRRRAGRRDRPRVRRAGDRGARAGQRSGRRVPAHLNALDRKQFLLRESRVVGEDEAYRFRNLLIRDATYGSLLKRARAQLHERFVTWAERVNEERGREQEFEEILGYHLEQAYRYRRELGPVDAEGRAIASRAADKLGSAGRRAFARGDLPAAASLLRRAIDLLAPDDPARIEAEVEVGEVLLEAGDFTEATGDLEAAIAAAEAIGDDRLRARARLGRLGISLYAEELESGAIGRALEEATQAAELFEAAGDEAGLARAWRLAGSLHATAGQYEAAAEAAERVVAHATRAGDKRLASRAAAGYATIARAGSMTAAEVARRCGPLLDQVSGDRKAEAVILGVIAVAEAMQGRFDRARDLHTRAKMILGELGRSVVAASTSIEGSRIEMLAGDAVQAEALLAADSRRARADRRALLPLDRRRPARARDRGPGPARGRRRRRRPRDRAHRRGRHRVPDPVAHRPRQGPRPAGRRRRGAAARRRGAGAGRGHRRHRRPGRRPRGLRHGPGPAREHRRGGGPVHRGPGALRAKGQRGVRDRDDGRAGGSRPGRLRRGRGSRDAPWAGIERRAARRTTRRSGDEGAPGYPSRRVLPLPAVWKVTVRMLPDWLNEPQLIELAFLHALFLRANPPAGVSVPASL